MEDKDPEDEYRGGFGKQQGKAYQATMKRVMLRMVAIEGGGVARRRVPESELKYSSREEDDRVTTVIERLVKARLLVKGQETGEPYVEPAHDFLVRGWDKLQSWIKEEQEDLALQQRLTIAAQDWIRRRGSLWIEEADRLIKLNGVINSNNNWLNRLETVFVKRSSKVRQDRIKKLEEDLRISEQRRRIADSRQLAAQSQTVFKDYPQRALLLAVEALQVTLEEGDPPVVAAEQTLRDALSNTGGKLLQGHTRGVIVLTVSPNNRWLVSASDDGTVHLWNIESKDFAQSPIILKHDDVRTAVFSCDGHWLATGGGDGIVRLWDLAAENIAAEPKIFTHVASVWSIAISPNKRWLAAGTLFGGDARLWDLSAEDSNSNPVILHQTRQTVGRIDFSQDNNWVAIGTGTTVMPEDNPYGSEGNAYLWNLQAQYIPSSMQTLSGHQGAGVNGVSFSPDNRWLATAGDDGIARLWDLYAEDLNANSIPLHGGHKAAIRSIAFSPDNHWLATGSIDSTARLWDMKSRTPASTFMILQGHERSGGDGLRLAFSSDSHWLATFGDKKARLWDLTADNPADKPTILRGHDSSIMSATFSPDNHWFITGGSGGWDNFIRLWDLNGNSLNEMPHVILGNKNDITSSAISQNKKWLLTESEDCTIRLWELTAENVASNPIALGKDKNFYRVLAISSDKRWGVIIDEEKTTHLWNLETNTFKIIHQQRERVYPVVFSYNNRWLATGIDPNTPDQNRTVENSLCQLWDLTAPIETFMPISLKGHEKDITSIIYSADNRWLVTASEDRTAQLWDLAASNPSDSPIILQGHQDGVSSVAISPNGHWLMTGGRDNIIRLWNLSAENPATSSEVLQGHQDKVRVAAFSPDNRWLVTGSYDSTVRLWDLKNNHLPTKSINLRGFEHFIITLDISQDGHWLVAGSVDGNIGLWNLASRDIAITEAIILRTGKTFVGNVAITPDNRWIVSVSHDRSDSSTIQLWSLDLETMIHQARRLAGRHLTVEEWEQYLPSRSYPYQLS
jgi:WD40 repeat protein